MKIKDLLPILTGLPADMEVCLGADIMINGQVNLSGSVELYTLTTGTQVAVLMPSSVNMDLSEEE